MFNQNEILEIAQLLNQYTTKTPSGSPPNNYLHGPDGVGSTAGLRPGIVGAGIAPIRGLAGVLPYRANVETTPYVGLYTGVTASSGSEPDAKCDDPIIAGVVQMGQVTRPFGWLGRRSREVRLDRIGKIVNRGETMGLQLNGDPLAVNGHLGGSRVSVRNALANEMSKLLHELSMELTRASAGDIYSGNPSNNTANGGRSYFQGLNLLISDSITDAVTTNAIGAASSTIFDFNDSIDVNGTGLVEVVTYVLRNLKYVAEQAGLDPATWTLSMSWKLFYELTAVWPCSYQTYRCSVSGQGTAGDRRTMTANELNAMTDGMRQGNYLLVDGFRVPVVIDNTIAESQDANGIWTSDIYVVPMTAGSGSAGVPISEGGGRVTYMEYSPFDGADGPMMAARELAPNGAYGVSDNGRYLYHRYYPKNICVQIAGWTEERLMLDAPHLAGRITNVQHTTLIPERDWNPSDTYHLAGGQANLA